MPRRRIYSSKSAVQERIEASKKQSDWLGGVPAVKGVVSEANPQYSESSGVLPNQVAETRADLQQLHEQGQLTGVSIEDDGRAAFTSTGEQGRKGWMRYRKMVDHEGGYGDTYTDDGRFGD